MSEPTQQLHDERSSGYWKANNSLFDSGMVASVKPSSFVVYAYLCRLVGQRSKAWPKAEVIASRCGLSRDTVFVALKELQDRGMLRVERKYGKANDYFITDEKGWKFPTEPGESSSEKSDYGSSEKSDYGSSEKSDYPTYKDTGYKDSVSKTYLGTLPSAENSTEPAFPVEDSPRPDPSSFFLEPDVSPPPVPRPPSPTPPPDDDPIEGDLMFKASDQPVRMDKASRRQIESRAHGLASGYYKGLGIPAPKLGPAKIQTRQAFEDAALDGGYMPDDVEGCTRWLMSDPFWSDKMVPASEVGRKLSWWMLNGRPESYAKPISRAQQRNQSFSADLKSSHDRTYNLIKQRMGLSDAPEPDDDSIEVPYVVNQ